MMWCYTTSGHLYSLTEALAVTAPDNGAKVVELMLTYGVAIDDVTNNDVVLDLSCALSAGLMVA